MVVSREAEEAEIAEEEVLLAENTENRLGVTAAEGTPLGGEIMVGVIPPEAPEPPATPEVAAGSGGTTAAGDFSPRTDGKGEVWHERLLVSGGITYPSFTIVLASRTSTFAPTSFS